jgi:cellulose synthase/poly-beta-1,6-N-acetylglucosamine synthase-like glycosyltransferase
MHVTVAISTWNRARHLEKTLGSMLDLRVPEGVTWELLVVNNNCTDDTDDVIARHADRLPVRRLFEARQGKSHACNLLVREAAGELVLWTDDDVWVPPDWMEQYVRAARHWPQAAFFGGTVEPLYEAPPPAWVERALPLLFGPLVILRLGDEVRQLADNELPFGANMAIRRDVLRDHPFDGNLGPISGEVRRGEETKLLLTLQEHGHQGIWVGPARVRHWVPRERMTEQYVWQWFCSKGGTLARQWEDVPGRCFFGLPRWALRKYAASAFKYLSGCLMDDRRRIDGWRSLAHATGVLTESWRRSRRGRATSVGPGSLVA